MWMSGSLAARVPNSVALAAGNRSEFSCSETQVFPEQL